MNNAAARKGLRIGIVIMLNSYASLAVPVSVIAKAMRFDWECE